MKKLFIPVLVAAAALIAASCQKETEVEAASISGEAEFTATTDSQATKTTLDGDVVKWSAGDEISINGVTYTGVPDKFNPTWATFSKKSKADASPRSPFKAFYPASLYQPAGAMTILPEEQKYGDFSINPMYAESEGRVLEFKNICGVLAIKLEKSDLAKIKGIRVSSSNHGMCGEFTVEPTETGFKAVLTDEQALTPVVLSCGEAVELSEDTTVFHIAIPEQRYKSLKVEISADGLNYGKSMTFTKTASVKANRIYPIDFNDDNFYPGTELEGIKIGDVVWAPVNCGYDATDYPYGKLYQWGRKDGCGYNATWIDLSSQPVATETAIQRTEQGPISAENENASYFYKNGTSPCDWLSTQNDYRWNSATGDNGPDKTTAVVPIKTTYDPCPTGWRVPTYYELNALKGTKMSTAFSTGDGTIKGYWFGADDSNKIFLPAAGYRHLSNGNAFDRGSNGYYWSSSVNGYYGRRLNFYSGDARMDDGYRADGYSVRCVQE